MNSSQKEISTQISDLRKSGLIIVWTVMTNEKANNYRERGGYAKTVVVSKLLNNSVKKPIVHRTVTADDKDSEFIYTPAGIRIHYTLIKSAIDALKESLKNNPNDIDLPHYFDCF